MAKKSALGRGLGALLEDSLDTIQEKEFKVGGVSKLFELPLDDIEKNPYQPRSQFNENALQELSLSIKAHGLIQPITVRQLSRNKYQIIAGERRWRASKLAGLSHVPILVREATPRGMLEMAIVENVQRVDLNALDRAKGLDRLMSEFGLTTSEVAVKIGKSVAYVSNSMRLLSLPDALKDGLLSGLISEGHARALSSIEDTIFMIEAYKIILRETGSVRRAEELARRMKAKSKQDPKPRARLKDLRVVSDEIDKMQDEFKQALSYEEEEEKDTEVKLVRSRSQTKLTFVFKGNLEDTEEKLSKVHKAVTR